MLKRPVSIRYHAYSSCNYVYYTGTRARDEQEIVENTFPDLTGKSYSSFREVNQYGIFARVIVRAKTGKLLSRTNLEKIGELNSIIQGISVRDESGANITVGSVRFFRFVDHRPMKSFIGICVLR